MIVFVDTSALLALLNRRDDHHLQATEAFAGFDDDALLTTNYVVVETLALVQRRLGMATLSTLRHDVLPALEVHWVDRSAHEVALDALESGSRGLSFVDHTSFGLMRSIKVRTAFTFDEDFAGAGFDVVPPVPGAPGTSIS